MDSQKIDAHGVDLHASCLRTKILTARSPKKEALDVTAAAAEAIHVSHCLSCYCNIPSM